MLVGDESAPAIARRFVRQSLEEGHPAEARRDDVELLTSELVTNVVRHAHTDLQVTLRLSEGSVCLIVEDLDPTFPTVKEPGGAGGWGLRLVDQLARQWGVEPKPSGKAVWALLTLEGDEPGDRSGARSRG